MELLQYLFIFERGGCFQELVDVMDDEEESVLHTFSFTNISVLEAGADRFPSGILGTSGISKDSADQTKEKFLHVSLVNQFLFKIWHSVVIKLLIF